MHNSFFQHSSSLINWLKIDNAGESLDISSIELIQKRLQAYTIPIFYKEALLELFSFELYKLKNKPRTTLKFRNQEFNKFNKMQVILHLPISFFKKRKFKLVKKVACLELKWDWTALMYEENNLLFDWDKFLRKSYRETHVFLLYKHGLENFVEQSDYGWFLITPLFEQPSSLTQISAAILEDLELGSQMTKGNVDSRILECLKWLLYWGYIEEV